MICERCKRMARNEDRIQCEDCDFYHGFNHVSTGEAHRWCNAARMATKYVNDADCLKHRGDIKKPDSEVDRLTAENLQLAKEVQGLSDMNQLLRSQLKRLVADKAPNAPR